MHTPLPTFHATPRARDDNVKTSSYKPNALVWRLAALLQLTSCPRLQAANIQEGMRNIEVISCFLMYVLSREVLSSCNSFKRSLYNS